MPKKKKTPPKRLGEYSEVCFMARALKHRFSISKPYGDSDTYDFIVDSRHGRLSRIQVRSTATLHNYCYSVDIRQSHRPPTPDHADFIAAYVVPCDTFYIVPIAFVTGRTHLWLAPHRPSKSTTEPFREAWHMLR